MNTLKRMFSALPVVLLFLAWLTMLIGFLHEVAKLPKF